MRPSGGRAGFRSGLPASHRVSAKTRPARSCQLRFWRSTPSWSKKISSNARRWRAAFSRSAESGKWICSKAWDRSTRLAEWRMLSGSGSRHARRPLGDHLVHQAAYPALGDLRRERSRPAQSGWCCSCCCSNGSRSGLLITSLPRYWSIFPDSATCIPWCRRLAAQGWLNQVTRKAPVPSLTRASTTWNCPPRAWRVLTLCTLPMTVTTSPYHSRLIGLS